MLELALAAPGDAILTDAVKLDEVDWLKCGERWQRAAANCSSFRGLVLFPALLLMMGFS